MVLLSRLFGSRNDRILRKLKGTVARINALSEEMAGLSDAQLRAQTAIFREQLQSGGGLEAVLPSAFAAVREASHRALGLRHYDEQLLGALILHQGRIAEMRTGEGKTLVATLAVYLNALMNKGVHVVTVNDYLAQRDADWMGPIYEALGLSVGVIVQGLSPDRRREAYAADVTYGTNNEFGFDYLRDNMVFREQEQVQRGLHFAIIDEVDSILIDEARTPLIISGVAEDSSELYVAVNQLIPRLQPQLTEELEEGGEPGDYFIDEKAKQVYLTDFGHEKVENWLSEKGLWERHEGAYRAWHLTLMHHVMAALRAHACYQRDIDYIVIDKQVMIVDEHTGRVMAGRRWSDGLHQAIEAKERVPIQPESQTLASITFQNYFRQYEKLSGMTGTADTEAYEFQEIYGLEVVVLPTHRPCIREDLPDLVYLDQADKFAAIVEEVKVARERGQPVLLGTASIEISEHLSALFKKQKVPHQVLNAKYHEQEAQIIAQAGREGAVTIATNMAGRGTDIVLGGSLESDIKVLGEHASESAIEAAKVAWHVAHEKVVAAGGLYVIGSERHESRRIDNQLRGRSGRQGDPGRTRFYLSLEDHLLRIFASERIAMIMSRFGMQSGEALESRLLSRTIENAQRKVEAHHFDIRKQLLEYDDVANEQRHILYQERQAFLMESDFSASISGSIQKFLEQVFESFCPEDALIEHWDLKGARAAIKEVTLKEFDFQAILHRESNWGLLELKKHTLEVLIQTYQEKISEPSVEVRQLFEKTILLQNLDWLWRDHLSAMEHLRQSVHLRGYAQKNPKQEYKREALELFYHLWSSLDTEVTRAIFQVPIQYELADNNSLEVFSEVHYAHGDEESVEDAAMKTTITQAPKVGRNAPCPCGSGKKYKHCHGQV